MSGLSVLPSMSGSLLRKLPEVAETQGLASLLPDHMFPNLSVCCRDGGKKKKKQTNPQKKSEAMEQFLFFVVASCN